MILQKKILIQRILKASSGFIFLAALSTLFVIFEQADLSKNAFLKPALISTYAPDFIGLLNSFPSFKILVDMVFPLFFLSSIIAGSFYFLGSLLFIPPRHFIPDEPMVDQEKYRHKVWPRLSHLEDVFYVCPHTQEETCYRDLAAENISLDAPRFKKINLSD
jgi:hypothetical protein